MARPNNIILINKFPDYKAAGFDEAAHDSQFLHNDVIIHAQAKDVYFPEHWGPLSIKCCIEGAENYTVGSRRYRVDPANFLILNEGQYYSSHIYSKEKVSSFTINFSRDTVRDVVGDSAPEFVERLHDKKKIADVLEGLRRLSANGFREKERLRESLLLMLERLMAIQKATTRAIKHLEALRPATQLEIYKRLHFVKDYIDSCYQQEITLDELAKVAHLNGVYLLRRFRSLFAITPRQYLIRKRIDTAASLLRHSSLGVGEICMEIGYHDISSFSKLFHHFHHCSPVQYRSRFRKKH